VLTKCPSSLGQVRYLQRRLAHQHPPVYPRLLRKQPATVHFRVTALKYIECLEWYDGIFHDSINHRDCHFTRFAHMLYHFCILQMLSPYVDLPEADFERSTQPRETCHQAAQNVLRLAVAQHPVSGPRASPGLTLRFTSEAMAYLISRDRTDEEASGFTDLIRKIQDLGFQTDDMKMPTQIQLPQQPPLPEELASLPTDLAPVPEEFAPLPAELTPASIYTWYRQIPTTFTPHTTTMGPQADSSMQGEGPWADNSMEY
jgi:hypothetical protein